MKLISVSIDDNLKRSAASYPPLQKPQERGTHIFETGSKTKHKGGPPVPLHLNWSKTLLLQRHGVAGEVVVHRPIGADVVEGFGVV